jgi:S-adenosylmethionine synthetase
VSADVREEELQAVGSTGSSGDRSRGGRVVVVVRVLLLGRAGCLRSRDGQADVETDSLELARELLDVLVVEVELERERLELGRLDIAALFCAFDERLRLIRLE